MAREVEQSLSIWSPRPRVDREQRLSEAIAIYGLPAIDIVPIEISAAEKSEILNAEVLLFISRSAVESLLAQISASALSQHGIVAIGEQTAASLVKQGLSVDVTAPTPFTSEALLQDKEFATLHFQRLALIAGERGRNVLERSLLAQGKSVARIACYRRDKGNLSPQVMIEFINQYKINGLIVSSCAVADAVMENVTKCLPQENYQRWVVFVFSQRIAEYMQAFGFKEIIVAETASQLSINEGILTWWESR